MGLEESIHRLPGRVPGLEHQVWPMEPDTVAGGQPRRAPGRFRGSGNGSPIEELLPDLLGSAWPATHRLGPGDCMCLKADHISVI